MYIYERKSALRKRMEAQRSELPVEIRAELSQVISERAIGFLSTLSARSGSTPVLFTYMPFRTEVDVTPVMEWCWQQGIQVAVARVVPADKQLKLHLITQYADVESGSWGIREPRSTCPELHNLEQITWMFVPGLAFDVKLGRLGYGGGYYDRFLQQLATQTYALPLTIAPAFDRQIVPEVPLEEHDKRVDQIITETRFLPNR